MKLRIHTDGACRGNPGPMGIGVVVQDGQGALLREISESIGRGTNNIAEYRALLRGLEEARALGGTELEVCSDSQLMVRQLSGQYRVKNAELKKLHAAALRRLREFTDVHVRHVLREQNAHADRLAEAALGASSTNEEGTSSHVGSIRFTS